MYSNIKWNNKIKNLKLFIAVLFDLNLFMLD